jgi:hypothetical protein
MIRGGPIDRYTAQFAAIPVGQQAVDAVRSSLAAEEKLRRDLRAIEAHNAPITKLNARLVSILTRVAGQDLGDDSESWQRWYTDLLGYAVKAQVASAEKQTIVEDVPADYVPQAAPVALVAGPTIQVRNTHSCFAAGTPVRTLNGLTDIEKIRVGDQVLSQDTHTGELQFKAVATAFHNPPNTTVKIDFGGEPVV